jgi:hypothetical protein
VLIEVRLQSETSELSTKCKMYFLLLRQLAHHTKRRNTWKNRRQRVLAGRTKRTSLSD